MFFEIGVLKIFCNIRKKTLLLKSLFNIVTGLKACNFMKKRLQHRRFTFSCKYSETFKYNFLYRTTPVAASAGYILIEPIK